MASSAQKRVDTELSLSPREGRLHAFMKLHLGQWVASHDIVVNEYSSSEATWPINARMIITTTMRSLTNKLARHAPARRRIIKRGGGRGGVEYKLARKG